jgi:hypothetical protein
MSRRSVVFSPLAQSYPERENIVAPENYDSPNFEQVELEFKNQLLSFTLDLLLNNADLVKNIAEISNKVIFKVDQLKQLIAILYLNSEDRKQYDQLIDVETEELMVHNCLCNFKNHFYLKIKDIIVNKSIKFRHTPLATNMSSVFRISLEHCLRE